MRLFDVSIIHANSDHLELRKLRSGMRPVQNADDPLGFCSAADSRLTVYPTVEAARTFWYAILTTGRVIMVHASHAVQGEGQQLFDRVSAWRGTGL